MRTGARPDALRQRRRHLPRPARRILHDKYPVRVDWRSDIFLLHPAGRFETAGSASPGVEINPGQTLVSGQCI